MAGGKARVLWILGGLVAANALSWAWALIAFHDYPILLGMALLAYSFGLKHAVDADHIAAIDNVTRKLMNEGSRADTVGLFFSLGHSSVVIAASIGVAVAASSLQSRFEAFRQVGSLIGTSVSVGFLLIIAAINLGVLRSVWRAFERVRRGGLVSDDDYDLLLNNRGFLTRILRPVMRMVSKPWHLYPLGFAFGLGFDTATEISLLGLSAAQAAQGLEIWSILVFPVLFAAGMALVDTADSILMVAAYGWAFVNPLRKLYYNLTITAVSVLVALIVGGIEALGLVQDRIGNDGAFWQAIEALNRNFGSIGYLIIALFVVSWVASMAFYRWRGYRQAELP